MWVGHVARMRMRNAYKDLDRKPERNGPFWRPMCRLKETIRTDCNEITSEGLDFVSLAQDTEP
jgi:hypothetical protein